MGGEGLEPPQDPGHRALGHAEHGLAVHDLGVHVHRRGEREAGDRERVRQVGAAADEVLVEFG